MSISDCIVVMRAGVVQQIGAPQAVYDDPVNLFVAKFLGNPPINLFSGEVKHGKLLLGGTEVLAVPDAPDGKVTVGIRPEGFIPAAEGSLVCGLSAVEVMGRDSSVLCTHPASESRFRVILDADAKIDRNSEQLRFALKPHKLFLFHPETEERIRFSL